MLEKECVSIGCLLFSGCADTASKNAYYAGWDEGLHIREGDPLESAIPSPNQDNRSFVLTLLTFVILYVS